MDSTFTHRVQDMYTQCPNCRTVFRTGAPELAAAQGYVRCGRCRHVFDAKSRLYERLLDIPSAGGMPNPPRKPPSAAQQTATTAPTPRADQPVQSAPASDTLTPFKKTEAPEAKPSVPLPKVDFGEPVLNGYPTMPDTNPDAEEDAPSVSSHTEPENEPKPQAVSSDLDDDDIPSIRLEGIEPPPAFAASQEPPEDLRLSPKTAPPAAPEETAEASYNFSELVFPEEHRPAGRSTAAWSFAIMGLLVLLVFQYVYFMREDLARYPELRPWLEKMCAQMGCKLPLLRDLNALEITHRQIHSHPTVKGALLINATFVNTADFTQPYPILQISLSDISGNVVAQRRLQPQEYLGDGVDIGQGLSPRTPVHVVLEVVDPGRDAVGFQFEFL